MPQSKDARTGEETPHSQEQNTSHKAQKVEIIPPPRTDLAEAGDVHLGLSGMPGIVESGRLWIHKHLAKAQAEVLAAKKQINDAAAALLASQERLQVAIYRRQAIEQDIENFRENIRERVRAEIEQERIERKIKEEKDNARLHTARRISAEAELKAKEAEELLATRLAVLAGERTGDDEPQQPKKPPDESRAEAFQKEVEEMLTHGYSGMYMTIAAEGVEKLCQEAGVERMDDLPPEQKAIAEQIFEMARRKQYSKG